MRILHIAHLREIGEDFGFTFILSDGDLYRMLLEECYLQTKRCPLLF